MMARNVLIVSSMVESYNYIGGSSLYLPIHEFDKKIAWFQTPTRSTCAFCVTYG